MISITLIVLQHMPIEFSLQAEEVGGGTHNTDEKTAAQPDFSIDLCPQSPELVNSNPNLSYLTSCTFNYNMSGSLAGWRLRFPMTFLALSLCESVIHTTQGVSVETER